MSLSENELVRKYWQAVGLHVLWGQISQMAAEFRRWILSHCYVLLEVDVVSWMFSAWTSEYLKRNHFLLKNFLEKKENKIVYLKYLNFPRSSTLLLRGALLKLKYISTPYQKCFFHHNFFIFQKFVLNHDFCSITINYSHFFLVDK